MASNYYTGTGDKGETGILSNKRLAKNDELIEAIGNIDELNSYIGIAIFHIHDERVRNILKHVQNELFIIGANLATIDNKAGIKEADMHDNAISKMEEHIEEFGKQLPPLKKFVLPGGCDGAVHLQFARSLARRAERRVVAASAKYPLDSRIVPFLNRLSSFLFVAALYLNFTEGIEEENPTY